MDTLIVDVQCNDVDTLASRDLKSERGASEVESDPSRGTSTRRNVGGGSASGGTTSTGLRSATATAVAVPPSGLELAGVLRAPIASATTSLTSPASTRRWMTEPVVVRSAMPAASVKSDSV